MKKEKGEDAAVGTEECGDLVKREGAGNNAAMDERGMSAEVIRIKEEPAD